MHPAAAAAWKRCAAPSPAGDPRNEVAQRVAASGGRDWEEREKDTPRAWKKKNKGIGNEALGMKPYKITIRIWKSRASPELRFSYPVHEVQ